MCNSVPTLRPSLYHVKVLGVILVACYMVTKGKMLLRSGKATRIAISKLLQITVRKTITYEKVICGD